MPTHPAAARTAAITTDFIELDKLLKRENLAASGGEARYLIDQGLVQVNGEVETRRRRKCRPGDLVVFAGTALQVAALSPADGTGRNDGDGFSG